MVHDNKRAVADGILHSEVLRITREVAQVLETREEEADEDAVADAIGEILACFPVYRSYLPEGRDHLDQAFAARARRTAPTSRRRTTSSSRCCTTSGASRPGACSRPRAW